MMRMPSNWSHRRTDEALIAETGLENAPYTSNQKLKVNMKKREILEKVLFGSMYVLIASFLLAILTGWDWLVVPMGGSFLVWAGSIACAE